MPEAVSFVVTTYRKLARDETGFTRMGSVRVPASTAIDWILGEFPEGSVRIEDVMPDGTAAPDNVPTDCVRICIDWSLVPDSVRAPKLPARRR